MHLKESAAGTFGVWQSLSMSGMSCLAVLGALDSVPIICK